MTDDRVYDLPPTFSKPVECDDAVDRKAVLKKIFLAETSPIGSDNILKELSYSVENMPSVIPTRGTGKWVVYETVDYGEWKGTKKYACDKCGEKVGVFKSNYCPHCGRKMEGGE